MSDFQAQRPAITVSEALGRLITLVVDQLGSSQELPQDAILGFLHLGGRDFAFRFPERCGEGSKLLQIT